MLEFIIVLLLISALGFVLEPYLTGKKSESKFASAREIQINELDYRKRELKASLADLELEHKSGMVSEEDYNSVKNDYKSRLNSISSELESLKGGNPVGTLKDQIEADIQKKRSSKM